MIPLVQSVYIAFTIIGPSIPVPGVKIEPVLTAFCAVLIGISTSTLLADPRDNYRKDGTPVLIEATPSYKDEVISILKLVKDHKVLLLTPAFLVIVRATMEVSEQDSWNNG
jgi:hypothetical protein